MSLTAMETSTAVVLLLFYKRDIRSQSSLHLHVNCEVFEDYFAISIQWNMLEVDNYKCFKRSVKFPSLITSRAYRPISVQ